VNRRVEGARHSVVARAGRCRNPVGIGGCEEVWSAVREHFPGPCAWGIELDRRSRYRSALSIQYSYRQIASRASLDIVQAALAFDDDNTKGCGLGLPALGGQSDEI
jgi:hypothetical protein